MPNLDPFIHTLTGTQPALGSCLTQIGGPFVVLNKNLLQVQGAIMGITSLPNVATILDGTATNATNSVPVVVPDNACHLQLYVLLVLKNSSYSSATGSVTLHPYGRVRATNIPTQSKYPQSVIPGLPDIVFGSNLADPTKAFGHWSQLGCEPANAGTTFNLTTLVHSTSTASAPYLYCTLAGQPTNYCGITNWSTTDTTPDANVWRFYMSQWSAMTASGNPSMAQPFDVKGYDRILVTANGASGPSFTVTATGEGDGLTQTNFYLMGHFF